MPGGCVKKVVSRWVPFPKLNLAWTLRLGLVLVGAIFICLATTIPESPDSQALAQSEGVAPSAPLAAATETSFPEVDAAWPGSGTTTTESGTTTTTEGSTTETTVPGTTDTTEPNLPGSVVDVDVVVYATQTSGLAAVRELTLGAPQLKVALISCGNLLETPLVQGLSVEDARDADGVVGGFYSEWRQMVIRYYGLMGKKAFTSSGRFVYEPEVAADVMWSFVSGANAPNVLFYSAKLVDASDQGGQPYVDIDVEGIGLTRLNTRYFIDASVEGDLARMLGADYRIGRDETIYNDVDGVEPEYPSAANNYATAPQRFSALLTLQVYSGNAPLVANLVHLNYNPSSYAGTTFAWKNVEAFASSWTMKIAVLPDSKRELNETWSDWPDIGLAFQWVMEPDKRGDIRKRVLEWSINRVRYLQEHGYRHIGIATIPQKLYVREGPRIIGRDTYSVYDLQTGAVRNSVAMGCYVEYDRHDAFYPTHVETTRYVHMPMEALMVAGHPSLLVSTAVSTDYQAYSSAVRMEPTRGNFGAAAAMIIIAADTEKVDPSDVSYSAVRNLLYNRGYRVE
jgi:hypothetical protein